MDVWFADIFPADANKGVSIIFKKESTGDRRFWVEINREENGQSTRYLEAY